MRHERREAVEPALGRRRAHEAEPHGALGPALEEGLRPGLERRVLEDVGEEPHALEPRAQEQAGQAPPAVWLDVDARRHLAQDALGELAVRVRDGDDAEVLVLEPDAAAWPHDARHLLHHA